jgi:glycosyltransferase involved in cell wall biosynthesis
MFKCYVFVRSIGRKIISKLPKVKNLFYKALCLYLIAVFLRLLGYGNKGRKSVLYAGQAYYNAWYLSRALRRIGWKADVLNWDNNINTQRYYHGEDFKLKYNKKPDLKQFYRFYLLSLKEYDVFHFSNKGGMQFGEAFRSDLIRVFGEEGFEIRFLKALGKKIVYSNSGCLDGVSKTSFSQWKPANVCSNCAWYNVPAVCSDSKNLAWGKFRNSMADYQCLSGGNRVDYNISDTVHEVPEFYCLDKEFWSPDIAIPDDYLVRRPVNTLLLYHAVGEFKARSTERNVNIKSTHIYLPLIDKLKKDGHDIDLLFCSDIPNKEVRFYQVQADIFLEMLTFGWFGANAREAMMLGKPVICYLRPEWLESARLEVPDYIDELPIISATPDNIEDVLIDLILNKEKRIEIGRKSREFAIKWHSAEAGACRFDSIYSELLSVKP